MSKQSRRLLAAAAVLLLLGLPRAGAEGAGSDAPGSPPRNLLAVSVERSAGELAAVELRLDGAVHHESFLVADPHRLVLDLHGVVSRLDASRFPVGAAGVTRVRAAQHATEPSPVARVVFDLERPLEHSVEATSAGLVVRFGEMALAPPPAAAPAEETAALQAQPPAADVSDIVRQLESRVPDAADGEAPAESRALAPDFLESLLRAPAYAAPAEEPPTAVVVATQDDSAFRTRTIGSDEKVYVGKRISLNFVDADIKSVFRLFHEISGLNFVLDPSVQGRVTIVLDQVPWDQALDIILKNAGLDKQLENNVIRIAPTQKLAQEAAERRAFAEAKELEVEPITITRTLSYGKAADVERVIRDSGVLTQRGKVIVDERTNTLIISDIPKKVDPLDELISTLDAETPQVMIEARVVEASRTFTQDLGVDWGFTAIADASRGTATNLNFPHNASARYDLNLPGDRQDSTLGFSFSNIIDSFTLDIALNALETEGRGRILSSPKVATQNNERAEIEQGVRIPIVNTTATEINVEFVSASLKMTVTPQITAEGTIILDVVVENNSPDFANTAGGIPSIRTQRAQTKVLIADGGTTVIGGIFTVNEAANEEGVPWFRKLPVFGWLFKKSSINNENRELLIFITPKIMRIA